MITNVETLFKIETNINFEWQKRDALPPQEKTLIRLVADRFALPSFDQVFFLNKRNKTSVIYRLKGEKDYVLRYVSSKDARLTEDQCQIIRTVQYPNIIRPILSDSGSYVVRTEGCAWICYEYQNGELFSGSGDYVASIVVDCLSLIEELRHRNHPAPLFRVEHNPELWARTLPDLIGSQRLEEEPFPKLLSQETKELLRENRSWICKLAENVSKITPLEDVAITHNDLNHANILVQDDKPFVLDVEDICCESVNVAAAHCIFKLLRHSVYEGHKSVEEIRSQWLPDTLRAIASKDFKVKDLEQFYLFGQLRILSDIQRILDRLLSRKYTMLPTDLEKKIMNLFELNCMIETN